MTRTGGGASPDVCPRAPVTPLHFFDRKQPFCVFEPALGAYVGDSEANILKFPKFPVEGVVSHQPFLLSVN